MPYKVDSQVDSEFDFFELATHWLGYFPAMTSRVTFSLGKRNLTLLGCLCLDACNPSMHAMLINAEPNQ